MTYITLDLEELLHLKSISDPAVAETGTVAVSVGSDYKKSGSEFKREIWVYEQGKGFRKLTSGEHFDRLPRLSRDGQHVSFLSDRNSGDKAAPKSSVYVVGIQGGEPWRINLNGEVSDHRWLDDGSLIVLASETSERQAGDQLHDELEFEAKPNYSALWRIPFQSGVPEKLTSNLQVWEFDCSPDGSFVAAVVSDQPYERFWYRSRLVAINPDSKEVRKLFDPSFRQLGSPRVSPDSRHILYTCSLWSDRGSQNGDLMLSTADGKKTVNLTEGAPYSVSWAEWLDHASFLFLAKRKFSQVFFRGEATGGVQERAQLEANVAPQWVPKFAITKGKVYFSAQRADSPPELWSMNLSDHRLEKLSEFNSHLRHKEAEEVRMNAFEWSNERGVTLTGFVRVPKNYSSDSKWPLIVQVHGGPTSSVSWTYMDTGTVAASQGFLVFYPNYTGSTGRGRAFAEANRGDMGGQDLQDILAGVKELQTRYSIDQARIYITGGSYGGFMSMWAVTQTEIFRASAALFGISNWVSFHGTSCLSDWDEIHYAQSPYEFDLYDRFSPIRNVKKVKTPTLLLHGEQDPYVPVGQSYEFYRALKDRGIETSLIVYPREGHGFREEAHFVDAYTRVLNWFKSHQ
ncbi:MAG: S9 family peptidase [Thermoprotei archaeon]